MARLDRAIAFWIHTTRGYSPSNKNILCGGLSNINPGSAGILPAFRVGKIPAHPDGCSPNADLSLMNDPGSVPRGWYPFCILDLLDLPVWIKFPCDKRSTRLATQDSLLGLEQDCSDLFAPSSQRTGVRLWWNTSATKGCGLGLAW